MVTRAKLIIAYLGGPYLGWQRQATGTTVQGELEAAISAMTGGWSTALVGAGRTDAGVHARAQVAHVDLPDGLAPEDLQRGLNARLPTTIRVRRAVRAGADFHARFDASGKHYAYRARWRPSTLPWVALRTGPVRPVSDPAALEAALASLPGRHDFASFTVPDPGVGTVRTLHRAWSRRVPGGIDLHFVGDGFLRYQVRRLAGALLEVGRGRLGDDELAALLAAPTPGAPILTAPAAGLTLERVYYRDRDRDR